MNAGTRTIRTKVASTRTASVRPSPNIRMNDTLDAISAAKEIDMINAAAVTTRPVRAIPRATLSSLSPSPEASQNSADSGDQEHLVVHRQAESDTEQQHRDIGDQDPAGRRSERAEVPILEDPHHRAERGSERKHVEHQRFQRYHDAARQQEEQDEHDAGDQPEHQWQT